MARAAAVLISLALHAVAALVAVALSASPRTPPRTSQEQPVPIPVTVKHGQTAGQRGAPTEEPARRGARATRRESRQHGRPQFAETIEAQAPAPVVAAARPGIGVTTIEGARLSVVSPISPREPEADGDSSRRASPDRADPTQWSTLLLVGSGRARTPAPSRFCVPRAPAMPAEAVEQDLGGRVVARYDVGVDGVASAIEFVNRPPEALAGAVRAWLRGCLFEPALLNGRPVPARQEQSFLFVLR